MSRAITRVFDILEYQNEQYPQKKALNTFINGAWKGISTGDLQKKVDSLSLWLLDNGYEKGDKIAIMPQMGRPEWMIIDFACQQIGVVIVPLHATATEEEINYILTETETKLCITADAGLYYKLQLLAEKSEKRFNVFHLENQHPGYFEGLKVSIKLSSTKIDLERLKNEVTDNDLLTILYTSGTTGQPKGVMLTHSNVVSNILSIMTVLPLDSSKKVLSFLPFSHIMERTTCYAYIAYGASVYFSSNRDSFAHDFKTVQPYFCTMVPRVLEKMYDYLQEQLLSKNSLKRVLSKKVFKIAKKYGTQKRPGLWLRIGLFFSRILVLNSWRKMLGGKIKYMAVGAAALRPEIGRFFSAAKIGIREGYGMTETSPIISLNRFDAGLNRFGTVGIPVPGVEVKIDSLNNEEEGEILVKGPNIMKGYYKQPKLTKEVFTADGWLKTGDVGLFVDKKFLKITDRKKDIFKTSTGKYIAPQPLENHFVASRFIQQCLVIGFQRPFVTALLVPHFEMLKKWCEHEGIHWTSSQYMIHNIKVKALLQSEMDQFNEELPNYKRIRNFVLCHEEWTVETGEMTTSLKPIRKTLQHNNSKEIEKMYTTENLKMN
jgi:long-chain acyl-CoA synthetase